MSDDDIKDFTTAKKPPRFKIDDDIFTGVTDMPAELAMEFSTRADSMGDSNLSMKERIDIVKEVIDLVLVPASAEIFKARLSSRDKPIGVGAFKDVLPWLFEHYAARPTTPDSDSSSGSGNQESGTNSMESTSAEA